jgi:hypothetical protein
MSRAYKNYHLMRKMHKVKFLTNPTCKDCDKHASILHHNDFSKTNHSADNLIPLCQSCHMKRHKNHGDLICSKPRIFYKGQSLLWWSKKLNLPYSTIYARLRRYGNIDDHKTKFEKIYGDTLEKLGKKLTLTRERVRQLHYSGELKKRLAKSQVA